jgi:hypothetical protein
MPEFIYFFVDVILLSLPKIINLKETEYDVCTLVLAANNVGLGGVMVVVLAIVTKGHGFKPGRGRCTFKGDKNSQQAFLQRGSKAVGSMS